MPAAIGATSRALALTVNAIATAMIGGVRLAPGDRYAAVADVVARTVHKACTLDHARLAESRFVIPPPRIEDRTLASGAWFYANFMDAPSFPGARLPAAAAARARRVRRSSSASAATEAPPSKKAKRLAPKGATAKRVAPKGTMKRAATKGAATKRAATERAGPKPKRPAPNDHRPRKP